MPRVAGEFNWPPGIYPQEPNTTIESDDWNTLLNELKADANLARPIVAGGTGASTAAIARDATHLQAERAMQVVTNYDGHIWEAGSFQSAVGATGSPEGDITPATAAYHGSATVTVDGSVIVIEARNLTTGVVYTRTKSGGTWSAWKAESGIDLWVDRTGDTMTGHLTLPAGPGPDQATRKDYVDTRDNAMAAAAQADDLLRVLKAGDTMSGQLTLTYADPILQINKTGNTANLALTHGGAPRFTLALTASDDLEVYRYDNGGTPFLSLNINRLTGKLRHAGQVTFQFENPNFSLDKTAASQTSTQYFTTGGAARWAHAVDAFENMVFYRFNDAGTPFTQMDFNRGTGAVTLHGDTTVTTNFAASNNLYVGSQAFIDADGNAPEPKIQVGPHAGWEGAIMAKFTSSGGFSGITLRDKDPVWGADRNYCIFLREDGVTMGAITSKNPIGVNYLDASDERYKSNIRNVEDVEAIDIKARIMGLQVIVWQPPGGGTDSIGLSAQQAHAHMPEIVAPPTPAAADKTGTTQPWMIAYPTAVPQLIAGMQAMWREIEELRAQLAAARG